MPGIAGVISKLRPNECQNKARSMLMSMQHETFYRSHTYFNERLGVYVGTVASDGSFSDSMPILNEKGDIAILFSGENFPSQDVSSRLMELGCPYEHSDAKSLTYLYEHDRDKFFGQLNGWFSGVLIDLRVSEVVIFNDRYGMGRVYYHEDEEGFLFSSEAKALLKVKRTLREMDLDGLGQLLCFGCTLQEKSLFSGISIMPGGSAWKFRRGESLKKSSYFSRVNWEAQPVLKPDIFFEKFNGSLPSIMSRYCDSKIPSAISLTGGLDSRMILACNRASRSMQTYTFGGLYRECLDIQVARQVAAAVGAKHKVIPIENQFFEEFAKYAERTIYVTDGCHDVCGSHDIFLNQQARAVSPIRVTGKFGGEVLRSVATLKAAPPPRGLLDGELYPYVVKASANDNGACKKRMLSYSVFEGIPWGMYGCFAAEQSQITMRSPYMDNDLVGLLYQAPSELLFSNELTLRLIANNEPGLAGLKTDRGVKLDRLFPLSNVQEVFYWSLYKLDWYYGVGMPDWLSRLEFKPGFHLLRNLVLGTQRIDHYRMWFKNELSTYVREILLDKVTLERPYWNKQCLEDIVENHLSGRQNCTSEINKVLTVELIQRSLIESNS